MLCDNCSAELTNKFCSRCGQDNRDFRQRFSKILVNVIEETFHFDGRILNTLKLLVLKPGELSKEFSLNRRAQYVPPVRLYLFASLLFFFIFALTRGERSDEFELQESNSLPIMTEMDTTSLDPYLTSQYQAKLEVIKAREGSLGRQVILQWAAAIESENGFKESFIHKILLPMIIDALLSPKRTSSLLIDNFALILFIGLPVHALVLKFFYFGKYRRYYIEHLVFSMHVHSVGFIVFTLLACVALINVQSVFLDSLSFIIRNLLIVIFFIYQYLALKRYYEQGSGKTVIKFMVLNTLYAVLLAIQLFTTAAFTLTELQSA